MLLWGLVLIMWTVTHKLAVGKAQSCLGEEASARISHS